MPFGLTNAPTTFQCLMNKIFKNMLRKYVLVFFDDVLIYSPSWYVQMLHLESVLQTLQQYMLFARLSTCSFGLLEVEYLCYNVSGSGVAMDKNKVQASLEWPTPVNVKQLRGFLGHTDYYRRFIKSYASIAAPFTNLLKKKMFILGMLMQRTHSCYLKKHNHNSRFGSSQFCLAIYTRN